MKSHHICKKWFQVYQAALTFYLSCLFKSLHMRDTRDPFSKYSLMHNLWRTCVSVFYAVFICLFFFNIKWVIQVQFILLFTVSLWHFYASAYDIFTAIEAHGFQWYRPISPCAGHSQENFKNHCFCLPGAKRTRRPRFAHLWCTLFKSLQNILLHLYKLIFMKMVISFTWSLKTVPHQTRVQSTMQKLQNFACKFFYKFTIFVFTAVCNRRTGDFRKERIVTKLSWLSGRYTSDKKQNFVIAFYRQKGAKMNSFVWLFPLV